METKLDSRQGQFPASFPDTFKDFFAMMSEEEDHIDLFSNLLEDKVIPRANKFTQRRYGGSLRSSTHPHVEGRGAAAGTGAGTGSHGRSNSFRVHRPRNSFINSSSVALSSGGMGDGGSSSNANMLCKHIQYCCLHQQQQQHQQQSLPPAPHKSMFQGHAQSQQLPQSYQQEYVSGAGVGARLGPDGEDNSGAGGGGGVNSNDRHQPHMHQQRHSVILERAFDFDASCDESDTISTTSSTPTATNIPYNVLKPILKQPQQQQQANSMQPTNAAAALGSKQQAAATVVREAPHRTLPQPPKGAGLGAYHSKESALQRVQQQSGLIAGSKTNLAALGGMLGSSANIAAGNGSSANGGNGSGTATGLPSNMGSSHYGGSSYSIGANSGAATGLYIDLHSPTATPCTTTSKFNDLLTAGANPTAAGRNIRAQKSPILTRRRSSSIVANLLTADVYNRVSAAAAAAATAPAADDLRTGVSTLPHSNTRDRISMAKSPVSNKPMRLPTLPMESGVLTFQQAISGAVSPQYSATSPLLHMGVGSMQTGLDMMGSSTALASVLEDAIATSVDGDDDDIGGNGGADVGDSPTSYHGRTGGTGVSGGIANCMGANILHSSSATIAQLGNRQRQRMRTSSMPAESRKPRLADTRRAAIHCADIDLEYYRLRSFSITSHGVCNLGDSLRSRRSRSINSVTSTGTSNSGKDRHNSNASRTSGDNIFEQGEKRDAALKAQIPAYKIAMLGASGVGKTTLTYQFTTSDYICAYDLSLDDDYGQKTVSVLVDGIETDLEIIDHPACEMSTEAFCSTYNIDLFVVVYSVVDRSSFKAAEKVLHYLKENEMLLTRGAILVGNKTDLERHREVNRQMARKLAKDIACKFIETSSGLDHNVDELLVGIVAQVKLNPQRIRNLSERDRQRLNLQSTIQKHRRMHLPPRRMVRQMSMCHDDDPDDGGGVGGDDPADPERDESQSNKAMLSSVNGDEGIGTGSERTASTSLSSCNTSKSAVKGPVRKTNKRTLNLESILKMGESELEDEEEAQRLSQFHQQLRTQSKFDMLTSSATKIGRTSFVSVNSSPKSRKSYESGAGGSPGKRNMSTGGGTTHQRRASQAEDNLLDDCNRKTVSKLTNRTKVFLSSVLKFKKAINVKRRNSSSCSDLFVI